MDSAGLDHSAVFDSFRCACQGPWNLYNTMDGSQDAYEIPHTGQPASCEPHRVSSREVTGI